MSKGQLIQELRDELSDGGINQYPYWRSLLERAADALQAPVIIGWDMAAQPAPAEQEPFAWATFDGEGSYDLRLYEENETYRDAYLARNKSPMYRSWVFPLYAAPIAAEPAPAQDEREVPKAVAWLNKATQSVTTHQVQVMDWDDESEPVESLMTVAQHERIVAALTRPAQAAPQPEQSPDTAIETRRKDEAEAVELQRLLFAHHRDCRPADAGLMGWAAAVLSAQGGE